MTIDHRSKRAISRGRDRSGLSVGYNMLTEVSFSAPGPETWGICDAMRTDLHAVACHRAHRASDLREDHYGGQPEER
jgi:hypothetical protein